MRLFGWGPFLCSLVVLILSAIVLTSGQNELIFGLFLTVFFSGALVFFFNLWVLLKEL